MKKKKAKLKQDFFILYEKLKVQVNKVKNNLNVSFFTVQINVAHTIYMIFEFLDIVKQFLFGSVFVIRFLFFHADFIRISV